MVGVQPDSTEGMDLRRVRNACRSVVIGAPTPEENKYNERNGQKYRKIIVNGSVNGHKQGREAFIRIHQAQLD